MEMLKKALELKNDYDDAMAYMNLMYRERADIQCGDTKADAADLKAADQWVDLTIGIKARKFEEEDRSRKGGSANIAMAAPRRRSISLLHPIRDEHRDRVREVLLTAKSGAKGTRSSQRKTSKGSSSRPWR